MLFGNLPTNMSNKWFIFIRVALFLLPYNISTGTFMSNVQSPSSYRYLLDWRYLCKTSNISGTKSQNLNVKSRRCSNYIWVVNNFIAYKGVLY